MHALTNLEQERQLLVVLALMELMNFSRCCFHPVVGQPSWQTPGQNHNSKPKSSKMLKCKTVDD